MRDDFHFFQDPNPNEMNFNELKKNIIEFISRGKATSLAEIKENFYINSDCWTQFCHWYEKVLNFGYLKEFFESKAYEIIYATNQEAISISQNERVNSNISICSEDICLSIENLVLQEGVSFNESEPFASFQCHLHQQSIRVSLTHGCIKSDGHHSIAIRKIMGQTFSLSNFSKTRECEEIMIKGIEKKKNILVAGATGSGKTSYLNSLLEYSNPKDNLVILEDIDEIITPNSSAHKFLSGSTKEKSLKSYCSYSLRMSPDRIVIGEIRSDEVVSYLLMMNTGHRGILSTIHSNSAIETIDRLALLFSLYSENSKIELETIKMLACNNIDWIVYLKDKKVEDIVEIIGFNNGMVISESLLEDSLLN